MNCDEFRSGILAGDNDPAIDQHERTCPSCRSHADDLRVARQSLADPALWEEPAPELASQVEQLIIGAAREGKVLTKRPSTWLRVAAAVVMIAGIGAIALAAVRSPASDWEVALPATDLAPGAVARVAGWNEDSGTRMVVTIADLDPAPDGFVYEFWLSDGPLHISAGTFHSPGEIELWSGVSRADFPRLWITLEPIDEDASPSGRTVLDTG